GAGADASGAAAHQPGHRAPAPVGSGERGQLQLRRPRAAGRRGAWPDRRGAGGKSMKPQGSLAEHDFPELIHALSESRWTGLLTLTHMGVGRSVTVQEGRMVFAASTSTDDRLGELLLRQGRIGLRQYADASAAVGPGKRLGAVLVEQGILTPKELVRGVVEQTQEIIYGAFQWTDGQY